MDFFQPFNVFNKFPLYRESMDCKEDPGGSIYAEVGEGLMLGEGAGYLSTFAGNLHSQFPGDHNPYQVFSLNQLFFIQFRNENKEGY